MTKSSRLVRGAVCASFAAVALIGSSGIASAAEAPAPKDPVSAVYAELVKLFPGLADTGSDGSAELGGGLLGGLTGGLTGGLIPVV